MGAVTHHEWRPLRLGGRMRWVVVHRVSGRVFTAPGGESWCWSIVRVLGDEWTVEKVE